MPIPREGLALLALIAWPASVQAQAPPEIVAGADHEIEVIFTNNCVVYYDAQGVRTNDESACSGDQVAQADSAYAGYRREQGWDDLVADQEMEGGAPEVTMSGNLGRVEFPDGCTVEYNNRRGTRRSQTQSCTAAQVRQADDTMNAYRQEQGWGPVTGAAIEQ